MDDGSIFMHHSFIDEEPQLNECKMVMANNGKIIDKDIYSLQNAQTIESVANMDTLVFTPPTLGLDIQKCQVHPFNNATLIHSLQNSDSYLHEMPHSLYAGAVSSDGYLDFLAHQGEGMKHKSLDLHKDEIHSDASGRVYDIEALDGEAYYSDAIPECSVIIQTGTESAHATDERSYPKKALSSAEAGSDNEISSHNDSDSSCTYEDYIKENNLGVADAHASFSMHMEEPIISGFVACTNNMDKLTADENVITMQETWSKISSSNEESSFHRVREWVNNIQPLDMILQEEESIYWNAGCSQPQNYATSEQQIINAAAVRSLHPLSTVAHMTGVDLQEVPSLGMFSYLKTLNLSANIIVRVPIGCLPRTLHSLDLSRNKIVQIEGFRELTRLRVLNLSYNRILRIGHGLSNCTLLKQLNLSGNKIGEVEGLHRLLKLSVLDLSFNKLTTSKALDQLSANYRSLLAVNLVGNPLMNTLGDDTMRKLVVTLLPHVMYLNRHLIKVGSMRETVIDSVAKTVLGTSHLSSKPGGKPTAKKIAGRQVGIVAPKPHGKHVNKKLNSMSANGRMPMQQHPSRYQHHHHYSHFQESRDKVSR